MTTIEKSEKPEYKVIGTRPIRPDGVEKVTGKAQYGADIRLPGMIYGRSYAARTPTLASFRSTQAPPRPTPVC